jgi:hypothetical protein
VILYHATTTSNIDSILLSGLLTRFARKGAKIQGVWLHAPSKSAWALLHTQGRHSASLEHVLVLEVNVPRSWLKRFQRGLWYCTQDIPPTRITKIIEGADYAASAK